MMIKTQQLPQEEVERFTKENKAFKTSVLVVAAVMLCFIPAILSMILFSAGMMKRGSASYNNYMPWVRTITMLNSLLNPLIYCWRQDEMRKFVFKTSTQVVFPAN